MDTKTNEKARLIQKELEESIELKNQVKEKLPVKIIEVAHVLAKIPGNGESLPDESELRI